MFRNTFKSLNGLVNSESTTVLSFVSLVVSLLLLPSLLPQPERRTEPARARESQALMLVFIVCILEKIGDGTGGALRNGYRL